MKTFGIQQRRFEDTTRAISLQLAAMVLWLLGNNVSKLAVAWGKCARVEASFHTVVAIIAGIVPVILVSLGISYILQKTPKCRLRVPAITALVAAMLYLWMIASMVGFKRGFNTPFKIDKTYLCTDGLILASSMVFTIAIYFIIRYYRNHQIQSVLRLKADNAKADAQLEMLRYQINPHFMFNALYLVRTEFPMGHKGRETLRNLTEFFRYSLTGGMHYKYVELKLEIEAAKQFMGIQKRHFGDRLEFHLDIAPGTESYPIPPFTLHLLLENAVKYGQFTTENYPVTVTLGTRLNKKNRLILDVRNSGHLLKKKDKGTGTGIKNLRKRLANSMPDHFFRLFQTKGFVTARLVLNGTAIDQKDIEGKDAFNTPEFGLWEYKI
ncbi:MAG: hypothetical protein GY765_16310 [bacterium]|nr:hypothetical protein [bacterium]